ncbi:MAG: radical SAM protein [Spirochaetes bacterium]|nr:radical SAM protein [Spirochaetota bacterium]
MHDTISILLINPWIADFAAYNLWAEPLGLFYIASALKAAGGSLFYIDCLESGDKTPCALKPNGCSKYKRRIVDPPVPLQGIRRSFAIYGMEDEEFDRRLSGVPRPDIVLVTSHMTYWYPGVFRTIEMIRARFGPDLPVLLGGIYATLCTRHARKKSGATRVYRGTGTKDLLPMIEDMTGKRFTARRFTTYHTLDDFSSSAWPLHELGPKRRFFAVLTSRGCPFSCTYCASFLLNGEFSARAPGSVVSEIDTYAGLLKTRNVAFYDDALLVNADDHILPILRSLEGWGGGLRFHLPNGIHARFITGEIASAFKRSGVETIRVGLETSDPALQKQTGSKTTNEEYLRAVALFRNVGYERNAVGTYVIAGIPGQTAGQVARSIEFVHKAGAACYLSCFSPIPETPAWRKAVICSRFPVEEEPLYQNNSLYLLGLSEYTQKTVRELQSMAADFRKER